jgi:hypothetical protein
MEINAEYSFRRPPRHTEPDFPRPAGGLERPTLSGPSHPAREITATGGSRAGTPMIPGIFQSL